MVLVALNLAYRAREMQFTLTGRVKDMIIRGGMNLYPPRSAPSSASAPATTARPSPN